MATVAPHSERRTSFSPNDRKASASLREMPSYKAEASRALNRQEDLKSLSKRLSSNRDLLNADPSTKPWLKFRSISRTENLAKVREDAGQAFPVQEDGTYTATPATVTPANTPTTLPENSWRSRNISSDQSSENNSLNESYEYWIKVECREDIFIWTPGSLKELQQQLARWSQVPKIQTRKTVKMHIKKQRCEATPFKTEFGHQFG